MVRPDRASLASRVPLEELLTLLLRQFKRPLAAHGVEITDRDAEALAQAIVRHAPPDAQAMSVRAALNALVRESEALLAGWNLTFEQALDTEMSDIPGWETTAEFLDIANEKSNAELRIAAGATLLVALGEFRDARRLLFLAARDDGDVDAVAARRVLLFHSGVDPAAPDWLAQLQAWVEKET